MAKQTGPIKLTGRLGDIVFYKLNGKYYARTKSSLSGKRVKKDPHFKLTMANASLLATASRTASSIYRKLPRAERDYKLYRRMTGIAMKLYKEGKTREMVEEKLVAKFCKVVAKPVIKKVIPRKSKTTVLASVKRPAADSRNKVAALPIDGGRTIKNKTSLSKYPTGKRRA